MRKRQVSKEAGALSGLEFWYLFLETGSRYIVVAGLELTDITSLYLPQGWD